MKVLLERLRPISDQLCQGRGGEWWGQGSAENPVNKMTLRAFSSFDMSTVLPICRKHT